MTDKTLTIVLYPRAQELLEQFDHVERECVKQRARFEEAQQAANEAYYALQPLERRYEELLPDVAAALGFGDLGRTSYSWRVREALKAYRERKFAGPPTTKLREFTDAPEAVTTP